MSTERRSERCARRVHEYGGRAFAARGRRGRRGPPTVTSRAWPTTELAPTARSSACASAARSTTSSARTTTVRSRPAATSTRRRAGPRRAARHTWRGITRDMPWDAAELWVDDQHVAGGDGVSCLQPQLGAPTGRCCGSTTAPAGGTSTATASRWPRWRPRSATPTGSSASSSYCELARRDDRRHRPRRRAATAWSRSATASPPRSTSRSPSSMWLEPWGDGLACVAGAPDRDPASSTIALPSGAVDVVRAGLDARARRRVDQPRPSTSQLRAAPTRSSTRPPTRTSPARGRAPPVIVLSHGGPTAAGGDRARPRHPVLDDARLRGRRRQLPRLDRLRPRVPRRAARALGRRRRRGLRRLRRAPRRDWPVDGERAVIRGWSAGGYTTLQALTTTDAFAAGCSHYGVADAARARRATRTSSRRATSTG